MPLSEPAFLAVVRHGALLANGMPKYDDLSDQQLTDLRQYLRAQAHDLEVDKETDGPGMLLE